MKIKFHRNLAGVFGYRLIRRRKMAHLLLPMHLQALFEKHHINCVIDVGAHTGEYAAQLRTHGFRGEIFSFEPVASNFSTLSCKVEKDSKWHCFDCALGSEDAMQDINVATDSVFTSFHTPNAYATQRFGVNKVTTSHVQSVQVRRLDGILRNLVRSIPEPRVFLKMDTQGYDLEVFKGAQGVLDLIFGLQSEASVQPIYEDMPGHMETIQKYREKGYEITGMYPISRDHGTLKLIEFDCVMVR
jgi:FkbM family methyltransferase